MNYNPFEAIYQTITLSIFHHQLPAVIGTEMIRWQAARCGSKQIGFATGVHRLKSNCMTHFSKKSHNFNLHHYRSIRPGPYNPLESGSTHLTRPTCRILAHLTQFISNVRPYLSYIAREKAQVKLGWSRLFKV